MSVLLAGTVDSAYRRSITPAKGGTGLGSRNSFEVVMDSVAALLLRSRLSSTRTVNELSRLIARVEMTVNTADPRSSLIDVWESLLAVAETPDRDQSLAARRLLVVALAKMLSSSVEMPLRQRQLYWEMLKAYLTVLGGTPGYLEALTRIEQCFPQWMDVLHAAVRKGSIQPVTVSEQGFGNRRLSAAEGTERVQCAAFSTSHATYDEAQYFGNTSDHWRRHTSHR